MANNLRILVTGLSGSGKTTLVNKLKELNPTKEYISLIDLDLMGYRNYSDNWIINIEVLMRLLDTRPLCIHFGVAENIVSVAKYYDKIYEIDASALTDDHEKAIIEREIERSTKNLKADDPSRPHEAREKVAEKIKHLRAGSRVLGDLDGVMYKTSDDIYNCLHQTLLEYQQNIQKYDRPYLMLRGPQGLGKTTLMCKILNDQYFKILNDEPGLLEKLSSLGKKVEVYEILNITDDEFKLWVKHLRDRYSKGRPMPKEYSDIIASTYDSDLVKKHIETNVVRRRSTLKGVIYKEISYSNFISKFLLDEEYE